MDEDFSSEGSPHKGSRKRVIKMLQEQINDLIFYKNDYHNIESRLNIAENEIQMKEAEFKLKYDELNDELLEMKKQNQILIDQTLRFKMQQINENQNIVKDSDVKVQKWKAKYLALVKSSQNAEAVDKYIAAQKENISLSQKLDQTEKENEELKKALSEKEDLVCNLSAENSEQKKQIDALREESGSLQSSLSSLSLEHKKKTDLLVHQRSKQEYSQLKKKKEEELVLQKLEECKKELLVKEGEISRVNVALENEQRLKKKLEKHNEKLKKTASESIIKLQEKISNLQNDAKSLRKSKEESEESESSMEVELVFLRNQKLQLEDKLQEANKVHQKNIKLQKVVGQLRSAVDLLENSASSYESDAQMKESDLRAVLDKHFEGIKPDTEWCVLVAMADKALDETEALRNHVEELNSIIQRIKDKKRNLKQELLQTQTSLSENQKEFDEMRSTMILRMAAGKKSFFSRTGRSVSSAAPSVYDGASVRSTSIMPSPIIADAPVDAQAAALDFSEINWFKGAISLKIDISNFKARNAIAQANAKLANTEYYPITGRTVALLVVFMIRFTHFKRSEPFDPTTILSFATPRSRKEKTIEDCLQTNIDKLLDDHSSLLSKEEESNNIVDSNQEQIESLSSQISELQKNLQDETQTKNKLLNQIASIKQENSLKVDQIQYDALQLELTKSQQTVLNLTEQLETVKSELSNLIETVHQTTTTDDDTGIRLQEAEKENELLKQTLADTQKELEVCYASNKEKNRDILALERRNNGKTTRISLEVPDINIRPNSPRADLQPKRQQKSVSFGATNKSANAFFLNENVRDGLAQMQNAILSPNKM